MALTRARDEVQLTAAAYRRRFDGAGGGAVSRFVAEIPDELLERDVPWPGGRDETAVWVEDERVTGGRGRSGQRGGGWSGGGRARRPSGAADAAVAPAYRTSGALTRYVGREVHHEVFGRGTIVAAEPDGADVKFTVRFGTQMKKVLGRYLEGGVDGDPA